MATPSKKSARKASGKTVSQSKRAGLVFPVGRIASLLRKGRYAARVSSSAATYLTAVVTIREGDEGLQLRHPRHGPVPPRERVSIADTSRKVH
jgi:hypothetical protein